MPDATLAWPDQFGQPYSWGTALLPGNAIAAQDDMAVYYIYCKTATKSFTKCQNPTATVGIERGFSCLQCITFLVDCQLQTLP